MAATVRAMLLISDASLIYASVLESISLEKVATGEEWDRLLLYQQLPALLGPY